MNWKQSLLIDEESSLSSSIVSVWWLNMFHVASHFSLLECCDCFVVVILGYIAHQTPSCSTSMSLDRNYVSTQNSQGRQNPTSVDCSDDGIVHLGTKLSQGLQQFL